MNRTKTLAAAAALAGVLALTGCSAPGPQLTVPAAVTVPTGTGSYTDTYGAELTVEPGHPLPPTVIDDITARIMAAPAEHGGRVRAAEAAQDALASTGRAAAIILATEHPSVAAYAVILPEHVAPHLAPERWWDELGDAREDLDRVLDAVPDPERWQVIDLTGRGGDDGV